MLVVQQYRVIQENDWHSEPHSTQVQSFEDTSEGRVAYKSSHANENAASVDSSASIRCSIVVVDGRYFDSNCEA
jgi:hypothetical protein